jgi:hypothetical protein
LIRVAPPMMTMMIIITWQIEPGGMPKAKARRLIASKGPQLAWLRSFLTGRRGFLVGGLICKVVARGIGTELDYALGEFGLQEDA